MNSSQTDEALPVKASKPNFVTFFVYSGNSLLITGENSLFVTSVNRETILLVTYASFESPLGGAEGESVNSPGIFRL